MLTSCAYEISSIKVTQKDATKEGTTTALRSETFGKEIARQLSTGSRSCSWHPLTLTSYCHSITLDTRYWRALLLVVRLLSNTVASVTPMQLFFLSLLAFCCTCGSHNVVFSCFLRNVKTITKLIALEKINICTCIC